MRYKIYDKVFKNKNLIIDECRNIINGYKNNSKLNERDYNFMMEVFKHHPKFELKTKYIKYLYVGLDDWGNNYCFYIKNENGTCDDISYHYSIQNIPVECNKKSDFRFPFGKYKGQSIYDIDDKQYLEWLTNSDFLDRTTKVKINQFIKYGYIPFNPVAYSKSNNTK